MVNEFDKEIDVMLRDLAQQDSFVQTLPDTHLDADEISAFAENVLPKTARMRVTEHLADCSRCRKILANTVFLSSAEESEIIHEEVKTIVSIPAIPWYKQLFAFPNLAYTMGALALLLVGMIGLLVLQNTNKSEPMFAQADKSTKESGPNAGSLEGDNYENQPYPANSAANAPAAMATPALSSANTSSATNAPISKDGVPMSPVSSANSNTSAIKTGSGFDDKVTDGAPLAKKDQPTDLDAKKEEEKPSATPTTEDVTLSNEKGGERRDINKQTEVSQNQTQNIQNVSPDSGNVPRTRTAPSSPSTSTSGAGAREQNAERPEPKKASKKVADSKDADEELKTKSSEIRKIGDKTFRNTNGVWTDTSYSGGSTKNVKRGSDDYKKLDSGLQNIGNALGGTVIVVWGGKNYKIQ